VRGGGGACSCRTYGRELNTEGWAALRLKQAPALRLPAIKALCTIPHPHPLPSSKTGPPPTGKRYCMVGVHLSAWGGLRERLQPHWVMQQPALSKASVLCHQQCVLRACTLVRLRATSPQSCWLAAQYVCSMFHAPRGRHTQNAAALKFIPRGEEMPPESQPVEKQQQQQQQA